MWTLCQKWDREQKLCWKFLCGIITYLLFGFFVPLDAKKTACSSDGLGLNYTLPMFTECKKKHHPNGSEAQTIPKLIPYSPMNGACTKTVLQNKLEMPTGYRVCRFPDCESNPCQNGWCEETIQGYDCHCQTGWQGKHCNEDLYKRSHDTPLSTMISMTSETTSHPTTTGSSVKIFVSEAYVDAIFISELGDVMNFSSIPSTSYPSYMQYDPTERHIYWSDSDERRVYRANLDGTHRENITDGIFSPYGIAISERTRILYIAYTLERKVTSMSIRRGSPLPGIETDFVSVTWPKALVVDEDEGYLYISRLHGIVRALLNATNVIEEIYHNTDLTRLSGLSIDVTTHPRRIFFSDSWDKRTFYKEVSTPPNGDTSSAMEFLEVYDKPVSDVTYFSGVLYFVQKYGPTGIGIMTNYDQTNRSYEVQEIRQFVWPRGILITFIEP